MEKGKNWQGKDWIIAAVAALVLLVVAVQALQISSLKQEISAGVAVTGAATGSSEYDEMMAQMHPELAQAGDSGGMVGGC